jgi:hypothetical protein
MRRGRWSCVFFFFFLKEADIINQTWACSVITWDLNIKAHREISWNNKLSEPEIPKLHEMLWNIRVCYENCKNRTMDRQTRIASAEMILPKKQIILSHQSGSFLTTLHLLDVNKHFAGQLARRIMIRYYSWHKFCSDYISDPSLQKPDDYT